MHAHLKKLIARGEDETLDYKQEISSASKIAKSMSSFANHKGGILLVGVRDNGTIAGIRSDEEKYMLDLAAHFYCSPEIDINIKEWTVGGKKILECIVPKGTHTPYYSKDENGKWWAYVRVKDQTLLASKIVLDVLKRQSDERPRLIEYGEKEQGLLRYLNENDKITLSQFQKLVNISRRRASRILVEMISAGVIRNHTHEKQEFFTLSEMPE